MIVLFVVRLLTQPFMGFMEGLLASLEIFQTGFLFLTAEQVLRYTSQILILILLTLVTILLGVLARWFVVHSVIRYGDQILHSIPLVNKLYKTSQDVIHTLFSGQSNAFKQVVMVPFPTREIYSLGLVTRDAPEVCSDVVKSKLTAVFIPTTPNPTSGYLLMIKEKDITYLDMKIEDAIKFIISCGVIHPDEMNTLVQSSGSEAFPDLYYESIARSMVAKDAGSSSKRTHSQERE